MELARNSPIEQRPRSLEPCFLPKARYSASHVVDGNAGNSKLHGKSLAGYTNTMAFRTQGSQRVCGARQLDRVHAPTGLTTHDCQGPTVDYDPARGLAFGVNCSRQFAFSVWAELWSSKEWVVHVPAYFILPGSAGISL